MKMYTSIFHEETIYEAINPQKVEMSINGKIVGTSNINMVRRAIANSQNLAEKNRQDDIKKNKLQQLNGKEEVVNNSYVELI